MRSPARAGRRAGAALIVLLAAFTVACGEEASPPDDAGEPDTGAVDAGAEDAGTEDAGPGDAGSGDGGVTDGGAQDGGAGDAGADDAGTADAGLPDAGAEEDAGTDAGAGAAPEPAPAFVPVPTGTCPPLQEGTLTFSPAGLPPRDVRIWISDDADALDGPLVFYWHGTGSSPAEALVGLGSSVIDEITARGGIVAAPTADPDAGVFPWFLTSSPTGGREDDLLVADEVLGCALDEVGVDLRHVHSLGMSAGGLQTAQMSYRRSGYLASVVTYSGGLATSLGTPPVEDEDNLFAALIFHGGASDVVFVQFQQASERYWQDLTDHGHFAALCNHGGGHTIPTDARESVWRFFQDHPFGQAPSPYAAGLPASFPDTCALAP